MVRAVRKTCPGANMDRPNAPQFVTTNDPNTDEPDFQAGYVAWCNGDCAQSHGSLFSALPGPEHPCWAHFISRPMILNSQATAANALRQSQHNILGGSHPAVCYPQSTPAGLDSWQVGPSNTWDRHHQHASPPIDDTHRRATSAQSTRPTLPRLVIDSSQVSGYACTATTNMWYSGESGDNDLYRSPLPDLLQPNHYQGRSPSSSGSDGCHSPGSDGSWVDVAAEDVMDIEWTQRVPKEHSNLSLRQTPEQVLNLGRRESNLEVERGFAVSGVSNDYIRNELNSDIVSAGTSHVPEPTRFSLQTARDTEVGASHSGGRRRRALSARHDKGAVSTFNGIACLHCQVKRVPVSVSSVRVSET